MQPNGYTQLEARRAGSGDIQPPRETEMSKGRAKNGFRYGSREVELGTDLSELIVDVQCLA